MINKSQIIGNIAVDRSTVTSQPNFHEPFSSSLQKRTSESSTSNVIPTKKCFVVTSTISNNSMVQIASSSSGTSTPTPTPPPTTTTTSYVTFKPPILNKNGPLHRAEGSTILLGNKQYQLVKAPSSQIKAAVINGTNIGIRPQPTPIKVSTIHQYIIFLLTLNNTYFCNIILDYEKVVFFISVSYHEFKVFK